MKRKPSKYAYLTKCEVSTYSLFKNALESDRIILARILKNICVRRRDFVRAVIFRDIQGGGKYPIPAPTKSK